VLPLVLHLGVHFIQVVVQILKNHIQFFGHQQHFLQLDDVAVVELPQRFDLSQLYAFVPVCILLLHFLYRHHFACLYVGCFVDSSECSVA
jgi:hypothetical protein